jgi:hypothetical protein
MSKLSQMLQLYQGMNAICRQDFCNINEFSNLTGKFQRTPTIRAVKTHTVKLQKLQVEPAVTSTVLYFLATVVRPSALTNSQNCGLDETEPC